MHSNQPWTEQYDWSSKVVGIMYAGNCDDEDDIVYVVINSYWESQQIELPGLLDLFTWKMVVNTMEEDSIMRGEVLMHDRHCTIGPRSAMVFVAKKK